MRNFRNFEIWQDGIQLVKLIYKLVELLPDNEKFGLRSQLCRAAVSIPCNIAEGSSRSSEIDFKRFLELAIGSSFELETQLVIIDEIQLCSSELLKEPYQKTGILQEKINAFINSLKRSIQNKN